MTTGEDLGGSRRSQVRRIRDGDRTLVVKRFTEDGWARETAALAVLPPGVPAPRLIDAERPVVVMSDLGDGPSVADVLLGSDPVAAAEAVEAWATAIAALHRATAGLRDAFRDELTRRAGEPAIECTVETDLADAARVIGQHCAELGVKVPDGAFDELRGLAARLGSAGPAALTPADACPDNNIFTPDGLALIDFEGAQWRHLAWDIAYLTVPWPSCWCAWRLPDDVAARALATYRNNMDSPYARSPQLDIDVAGAAAGWTFVSTSWFLERALADDPPLTRAGPPRRAMIMHRLRELRTTRHHDGLADLAGRLHEALAHRWGEIELPLYPAARSG